MWRDLPIRRPMPRDRSPSVCSSRTLPKTRGSCAAWSAFSWRPMGPSTEHATSGRGRGSWMRSLQRPRWCGLPVVSRQGRLSISGLRSGLRNGWSHRRLETREAAEAGRAVAALEDLTAARAEVHRLRLLATQAEGAAVSMAGAGHSLQARGGAFGDGGSGLRASAGGAAVAGSCDPTGRASGLDSAAVVEVVTAGGSEASSVLGYLEALHTDIQALTAKALANMSGADRDAACQAAMGRLSQWALAFLLGIPQGTQALALLGYRAVERGAGSGAGAPAGLPVVSPVTQVSVIQAASRLNTLVSEVRAWVEAATKGGDALAGGVKVVSLGEDMQSYPVGAVIRCEDCHVLSCTAVL